VRSIRRWFVQQTNSDESQQVEQVLFECVKIGFIQEIDINPPLSIINVDLLSVTGRCAGRFNRVIDGGAG